MNGKELVLIVTGQDAAIACEEIQKIISEEFGQEIPIRKESPSSFTEQTKSLDPIAVAALVLAIPAAMLTSLQLADRLEKNKQLEQTINKIEKKVLKSKQVSIKVKLPDGTIKEITTIDTVETLDYFKN